MNIKNAAKRSAVIIVILVLSIIIGFLYQQIWHNIDLNNHPREYSEYVQKYAADYGVPEYIIYSVIHTKSSFQSNKLSDDGKIGLMQLSPETLNWLTSLTKEELDPGILYDPDTNIKYGTYMLSYLFTKYGRWKTVLAAYEVGVDKVNIWLEDSDYLDASGNLNKIPDKTVSSVVADIEEAMDTYYELYYNEK